MKEYVTIFCRESTERQSSFGLKMDVQEHFLREKAKSLNLNPVMVIRIAETGSKDQQRRKFYKMLEDMKQSKVKILLVEKVDRFIRETDMHLTAYLKKICSTYELEKIYFPGDSKVYIAEKGWSADEKLMMNIMQIVAGYKSDIISEEVTKALKEKADRGEPSFTPPVGYRTIRKNKEKEIPQQIIQTDDIDKVTHLLEIFHDKGYSLEKMLRVAKDIGLKSSRGNPLKVKEDVRRIIRNRFYYGEFESYGKIRKIKTKGFQPIISKKVWEENQKILELRKTYRKPDDGKIKFLFSQFVNCGGCGRLLYAQEWKSRVVTWEKKNGKRGKAKYNYEPRYVCTGRSLKENKCTYPTFWESEIETLLFVDMSQIELNTKVWDKIKSQLFRDEEREFLKSEIDYLNKEQVRNETRLSNLYIDCKEKGIISESFMSRKMEEIEKEQERVEERLSELKDTLSDYHEMIGKGIEILDSLKNFREKWQKMNVEKKKQMIKLLTIKISTASRKVKVKDTERVAKGLEITWNDEVRCLSELEIIKRVEQDEAKMGDVSDIRIPFNCQKNRNG